MLIDCGHRLSKSRLLSPYDQWTPAEELVKRNIFALSSLIVSNFDEDHVARLNGLLRNGVKINNIEWNRSLSPDVIRRIKLYTGGVGLGIDTLLKLIDNYRHLCRVNTSFGAATLSYWRLGYNGISTNLNNLSLVTFVRCGLVSMVFTGDIESDGWKILLTNANFRAEPVNTNVFVASHHGRESGYCADVFNYCHPSVIIISDMPIVFNTQNSMSAVYGYNASGIPWDGGTRKVLTTRADGKITIDCIAGRISASKA
jgi:beta-lactamase superfamily II metal-dependent hydrolase